MKSNNEVFLVNDIEIMSMKKTRDHKFRRRLYDEVYEFKTHMIFQFVEDLKYRVFEVENFDRFRMTNDESYDFGEASHHVTVCGNGRFVAYYDSANKNLNFFNLRTLKTNEIQLSQRFKDYFTKSLGRAINETFHNMLFSSSSRYFFISIAGDFLNLGTMGEIMVVDLIQEDKPISKYVLETIGYAYLSQKLSKHPIYDNYLVCGSYTDYSPTFEMFKLNEPVPDLIFRKDLQCPMFLNWNDDYVAYCIRDQYETSTTLKIFKFEHNDTSKNLNLSKGNSIEFSALCRRVAGLRGRVRAFQASISGFFRERKHILYYNFSMDDLDDGNVEFSGFVFIDLKKWRFSWVETDYDSFIYVVDLKNSFLSERKSNWKIGIVEEQQDKKQSIPVVHISKVYIPLEIFLEVVNFLDFRDILTKIEMISKKFRNSHDVWRTLYTRDYKIFKKDTCEFKIEYIERLFNREPFLVYWSSLKWENVENSEI